MLQGARKSIMSRNDDMPGVDVVLVPEFGWCEKDSDSQQWQCFIAPLPGGRKAELALPYDELPTRQQQFAWPRLHPAITPAPVK